MNSRRRVGGNPIWTFDTDGPVMSSPTVVDGTVYFGSNDSNLYALDTKTGEQEWAFQTGGMLKRAPLVANSVVYVGSDDSNLYALDAEAGKQRWAFNTGGRVRSSPSMADDTIYVGSNDSTVHAVNIETGRREYGFQTGGAIESSPTTVDETVYIGSPDGKLYAIDAITGEQQWVFNTKHPVESSPTVADGTVFVGSRGSAFYAVDAETGKQRWRFNVGYGWSIRSSPTVMDGIIYIGSTDNYLYAVDADTGEQRWSFNTGWPVHSSPTVAGDTLYVGSNGSNLHAIDTNTGEQRWTFQTQGAIQASPTVVNGTVYVGCCDGVLYAITTKAKEQISEDSRVLLGTLGHHHRGNIDTGTLESGAFKLDIVETSAPVAAGDHLVVTVEVDNTGDRQGAKLIEASTDGLGSETTIVNLDGGATTTESITLPTTDDDIGSHVLQVTTEGDTADETVEVCPPASFEISHIDVDETVVAGMPIALTAEVTNTSEIAGTRTITFTLDDVDSRSVKSSLDSGESTSLDVSLQTTISNGDEHSITVDTGDDKMTKKVRITEPEWDVGPARSPRESGQRVGESSLYIPPHANLSYEDIEKQEPIGSGGNADVHYGLVREDGKALELALKEPRMSGTLNVSVVEQMMEEAETWQKLDDHDHIVSVVDYDSTPIPWIAMEHMDRGHLGEHTEEMSFEQKLWTAIVVTKAVRHAHRRGVAHLDLKPENVLLRSVEDGWDVPKVADWGLSKHLLKHSKSIEGLSPQYAAPEQFDDSYGSADDVTDVYQLGSVFYELFTGQPLFEGQPAMVMNQVLTEQPDPPSVVADVSPALDGVLQPALEKRKDDRYDSVLYLRDELQDLRSSL